MALLLRADGCDYAEVAGAISVRPSSVGTILARATAALRAAYLAQQASDADPPLAPRPLAEGRLHHDAPR